MQSLEESTIEIERREASELGRRRLIAFWDSWVTNWMREFYCDLFATYCLGPAYAWSHCHLCLKLTSDPYETPGLDRTTHPSNASRMQVILQGLKATGFTKEATEIEKIWSDQMLLDGYSTNMSHKQCYPEDVLAAIATGAVDAFGQVGLRASRPGEIVGVALCLNQAWDRFWHDPTGFGEWESRAIKHLQGELNGGAS